MKRGLMRSVVVMVLLLIFLSVTYFIFFGRGLLPDIAKKATKFAENQIGSIKEEKSKEELSISPNSVKAFDSIVSLIDSSKKGPCLLQYNKFADTEDSIKLSIVEEGLFAQLVNDKKQIVKTKTLKDIKPCIVDGTVAENFAKNNLFSKCINECPLDYINANLEISADGILVDGKEFDLEDEGFLFRSREGSVCFFTTSNVIFSRGPFRECSYDEKGLYETCLEDIRDGKFRNNINICK